MNAAAVPYALSSTSELLDDYVFTDKILIDPDKANQVAPFYGSDGSLQCLAIIGDDSRSLVHVRQSNGVAGGWDMTPLPGLAGIEQVVVAVIGATTIALYQDSSHACGAVYDADSGSWTATPALEPFIDDLKVVVSDGQSDGYFYGLVSPAGGTCGIRLLHWNPDNGNFDVIDQDTASAESLQLAAGVCSFRMRYSSEFDGWSFEIGLINRVAVASGVDWSAKVLPAKVAGSSLQVDFVSGLTWEGAAAGEVLYSAYDGVSQAVQFVYRFPGDDQVYLHTLSADGTGSDVATGCLCASATVRPVIGQLIIYGVASDGRLSAFHQSGVDGNNLPQWSQPIPMATNMATVVSPHDVSTARNSLLGIDQNHYLTACLYDSSSGWAIAQVQIPQAEETTPLHLPCFQTEVQVVDAYGNPAPKTDVVLSSAATIEVSWQGQSYLVGPDTGQQPTLQTDGAGRLQLATFAFALTAHSLTATTADGTALDIAADQSVVDYFTGAGGLNDLPPFSGDTLQAVQDSDGNPLAPTLQQYPTLAGPAASAIQTVMALKQQPPGSGSIPDPVTGKPIYGYTLDLSDPVNPVYSAHDSQDAVTQARLALHRKLVVSQKSVGGLLHDLDKWGHDVWHAIRSGASVVSHWVVDLGKRTVSVLVQISDQITSAVDLALDDLEAVGSVVHSIFQAIGAAVDKVVDWLKAMFDWKDIVNTKKALEYYISGCFPALENQLSDVEKITDGFFVKQEDRVRDAFTALRKNKQLDISGLTLADLCSGQSDAGKAVARRARASTRTAAAGSDSTDLAANSFNKGPRHNWLLNKVLQAAGGGVSTLDLTDTLKDDLTGLLDTFESNWSAFEKKAGKMVAQLEQGAASDPRALFSQGVDVLLELLEDMILDLLQLMDQLIDLFIDLIKAILAVADSILTQPLDQLPLIGTLLKAIEEVSGADFGDLTLVSLVSLVLAVPVTVAYKLIHGADKQPFPQPPKASSAPSLKTVRRDRDASGDDGSDFPVSPEALAFANTGALALGALIRVGNDFVPAGTPVPKFLKYLFLTPAVASKGLTWPEYNFKPIDLSSTDKWIKVGVWMWGWLGIFKGLAEVTVDSEVIEPFEDPVLLALDSALGIGSLCIGLVALNAEDKPSLITVGLRIIDPLPEIATLVRSKTFSSESFDINQAVAIGVDIVAGGASVLLTGIEAAVGE